MRFLDEANLPADLQGARLWKRAGAWILTTTRMDLAPFPPLPIGGDWIDKETALALMHDEARFRQALRKHSQPAALDRFSAAICRQLPHLGHGYWRPIARDLGGPETAMVLAAAMTARTSSPEFQSCIADILASIGGAGCLPALSLVLFRMESGLPRETIQKAMEALIGRLGLTAGEAEDWCVPDDPDPYEIPALRAAETPRLRHAMLWGRRWTAERFERRIVLHPVVGPLAAALVWGYFDDATHPLEAFLTEAFLSAGRVNAPAGASIGIVHGAHLTAGEVARWRQETEHLTAPFSQWELPADAPSPEEISTGRIARLPRRTFSPSELLCRLEKLGWQRPRTRTELKFHTRSFDGQGVIAVIRYSGIPVAYGGEWTDQSIQACYFDAGNGRVPLSQVSRVAMAAVLADLEALAEEPGRRIAMPGET